MGARQVNSGSAFEKEKTGSKAFKLVQQGPIKHPALIQYLQKRKIDLKLAQKYLKEIRFEPASGGKRYFALGWPHGDGFEARNALFKGYVGASKGITCLETANTSQGLIFEGFMDFLSYLTENKLLEPPCTAIILNSGSLKRRAAEKIIESGISEIHFYLDNDPTGDECLSYFKNTLKDIKVRDMRSEYEGYKDLNEKSMNSPVSA